MTIKTTYKTTLLLLVAVFLTACASERQLSDDQAVEPPFQQRVSECARIGDRVERNRCLYGDQGR